MSLLSRFSRPVAVLLAATALTAPAWAADPIKLGMTVSSSGTFALASQSGERGVEVWVKAINAKGGITIDGEKHLVELIKRDDRSDKQMVARVYEDLINEDKVDVLMAPFGSTLTAAAATITERHGKFLNVWSASSNAVYDQGFKYVVSTTQMPVSIMPKLPVELAAHMGLKKAAFVHVDEPYPAGLAREAVRLAKENGIEVVMDESYPKGTKDFALMIQKAKALGADIFFPAAYEGDQMSMSHQMQQMDLKFPYVFMNYGVQPQFDEVGSAADYLFSNTNFHPSVNWPVNAGYDREQFIAAYDSAFPNEEYAPDFQTVLAYGAGVVMEKIIEKANSLEPAAMKQAALDLNDSLTVLAGPYRIDETGMQLGMPWVVVQRLPGNKIVSVWPEAAATDKPIPTPEN
jgi:branched-chain amino acid transport system substrate-binding protein